MEKQTKERKMPVRIIPIGGVEEIGRNMTVVEYGNEIVVIDAGIQFPEEKTPGIDFIIPNTEYWAKKIIWFCFWKAPTPKSRAFPFRKKSFIKIWKKW